MKEKKFTVLVADNEELVRKMISKFMKHCYGAICYEAENGKQALAQYKEKRIDLVISDYNMPDTSTPLSTGMNGLELLHELLAYDKDACVIIASADKDEILPYKAVSEGAKKFLHKPFDMAELVNALKNICSKFIDHKEEE